MITRWIGAHRDDLLRFTASLVATPSPNLPGDERAVVEVIRKEIAGRRNPSKCCSSNALLPLGGHNMY